MDFKHEEFTVWGGRKKYANNRGLWDGFLRRWCLIGFWENGLGSWELRVEGTGKAVLVEALQPEARVERSM